VETPVYMISAIFLFIALVMGVIVLFAVAAPADRPRRMTRASPHPEPDSDTDERLPWRVNGSPLISVYPRHSAAIFSPSSKRATKRSLSSIF